MTAQVTYPRDKAGDGQIHTRIRERRLALKLSQAGLGSLVGCSHQTIMLQERRPNRRSRKLDAIALALGVTQDYLLWGASNVDALEPVRSPQTKTLERRANIYAPSDGYARFVCGDTAVRPFQISTTDQVRCGAGLLLDDDSMAKSDVDALAPRAGALVFFERAGAQTSIRPGDLVVIANSDAQRLEFRRVTGGNGGWWFVADNPYYGDFDGDTAIVGVVTAVHLPCAAAAAA